MKSWQPLWSENFLKCLRESKFPYVMNHYILRRLLQILMALRVIERTFGTEEISFKELDCGEIEIFNEWVFVLFHWVSYVLACIKLSNKKMFSRSHTSKVYLQAKERNLMRTTKLNHGEPVFKFSIVWLIRVWLWRFLNVIRDKLILKTILSLLLFKNLVKMKLISG